MPKPVPMHHDSHGRPLHPAEECEARGCFSDVPASRLTERKLIPVDQLPPVRPAFFRDWPAPIVDRALRFPPKKS